MKMDAAGLILLVIVAAVIFGVIKTQSQVRTPATGFFSMNVSSLLWWIKVGARTILWISLGGGFLIWATRIVYYVAGIPKEDYLYNTNLVPWFWLVVGYIIYRIYRSVRRRRATVK